MSDDDRPLPAHIRRALDEVVKGPGRIPTTAHPDCICRKKIGTRLLPRWLWTDRDVPEEAPVYGERSDCPQHRPESKP